jgi:hypothetical protein
MHCENPAHDEHGWDVIDGCCADERTSMDIVNAAEYAPVAIGGASGRLRI